MKTLKLLTVAVLLLCTLVSLCACDAGTAGDTKPTEDETKAHPTHGTQMPTETDKVQYTVTVKDESGNPVAGAMIQLCKEMCIPNKTNEQGVAVFTLVEDDYKCSFLTMPAGYTYSTQETEFYFESGSREMTIVLKVEG